MPQDIYSREALENCEGTNEQLIVKSFEQNFNWTFKLFKYTWTYWHHVLYIWKNGLYAENAGLAPNSEKELSSLWLNSQYNAKIGVSFRNTIGSSRSQFKPDSLSPPPHT